MGCVGSRKVHYPVFESFMERYIINKETIGEGKFGKVHGCIEKSTSRKLAVKISKRDNKEGRWSSRAVWLREVNVLSVLSHANIINVIDYYEDRFDHYLVLERCFGGELFKRLVDVRHFNEVETIDMVKQMLSAVSYLHSFCIIHRDIKAENFRRFLLLKKNSLCFSNQLNAETSNIEAG